MENKTETTTTQLVRINDIMNYQEWDAVIQSYCVDTIDADPISVYNNGIVEIEINHEDQVPNDRVELNKRSHDSCYYTVRQTDLDNLLYR